MRRIVNDREPNTLVPPLTVSFFPATPAFSVFCAFVDKITPSLKQKQVQAAIACFSFFHNRSTYHLPTELGFSRVWRP
ncbi:hypothetical protein VNO77_29206 [Canavalia gladiata]|uniref:Uncharacterized protein n=1 Tax=Canavalia gladiata TaxID=3824 RepID=A0AAN9KZ54_CANGL